jgi:uncharacterized membrane protein YhaH (DUF805 family)
MEWMIRPYMRYADFSGRSRRLEFWMFALFYFLVVIVLTALAFLIAFRNRPSAGTPSTGLFILLVIFVLSSIIPWLAVQVRRFHDQNLSGWLVALHLLPVGWLIILVFMCIEGTKGENNYGQDPKGQAAAGVFD